MLLSNSCKLLIDKPTRITPSSATLIDHIISNNVSSETISGIGLCDISGHLAVFAIIPASYKCNKTNKRIIYDMRNVNQDHFLNDLCQQFNENLTPEPHPRLQTSYPPSAQFVSSPTAPSPPPHAPGCLSTPPAPFPP